MFFWPIRKYQIADWISQEEVDIVGLQEVRSLGTGASGNQLFQLQETLQLKKEYPYAVFLSRNGR
jgi:endonuclease/exonuclease/phosphatase family metal-dependent hydrolase